MMLGWGRIGDIRLRQDQYSYALIIFLTWKHRDYFIDAINGYNDWFIASKYLNNYNRD